MSTHPHSRASRKLKASTENSRTTPPSSLRPSTSAKSPKRKFPQKILPSGTSSSSPSETTEPAFCPSSKWANTRTSNSWPWNASQAPRTWSDNTSPSDTDQWNRRFLWWKADSRTSPNLSEWRILHFCFIFRRLPWRLERPRSMERPGSKGTRANTSWL